jgi:hypothetical protein
MTDQLALRQLEQIFRRRIDVAYVEIAIEQHDRGGQQLQP